MTEIKNAGRIIHLYSDKEARDAVKYPTQLGWTKAQFNGSYAWIIPIVVQPKVMSQGHAK